MKKLTEFENLIALLNIGKVNYEIVFQQAFGTPQIIILSSKGKRIGDVVCNRLSYGHKHGLLEILGLDRNGNPSEEPEGYLTADAIFNRIVRAYLKEE